MSWVQYFPRDDRAKLTMMTATCAPYRRLSESGADPLTAGCGQNETATADAADQDLASTDHTVRKRRGSTTWAQAWVHFTRTTTIHGLRFVWMDHAFFLRRLLWLLLVLACAVVMGYQITNRLIYFSSFPVTVNLHVNLNKTLRFPTLTLCNQNAFRATKATELGRYRLLEAMYTGSGELNTSLLSDHNATDVTLDELFLSTAHSKHDLIVDCEWQKEKCGPENFTRVLTDHSVCFTFNSNPGQPLLVSSTGSKHGLRLTLNIEQYEYMPGPHNAAGVKMLLHDRNEFPRVAELGLSVPAGSHAYVGVQAVQIENLPMPHGSCGSLSSLYYNDYTTDNCELACLTDLMAQECGCRHYYMPSKQGKPPVCTLQQYYDCYQNNIDVLEERVREECKCPTPCSLRIFDPAISLATTSVFTTDHLLATASRSSDLEKKYQAAMETTQRMEKIKFETFIVKEQKVQKLLQDLSSLMLHDVRNTLQTTETTIHSISNSTRRLWEKKHYLYRWQQYHVQKNFVRARDAMDERTFNYLAMGYQEYANLTESWIWTLTNSDTTSPEVKKTLYTLLMTRLSAKMDLCDRAFKNYTQLYSAYHDGTPIFRYKFLTEPRADNNYITPKALLLESLFHSDYAVQYSSRVGEDILKYKAAIESFAELATRAFEDGTVRKRDMYLADVEFLWRGRRYLHSKSTFDSETIDYPSRVLQDRLTSFERLWRDYDDVVQDTLSNIQNLKASLDHLETFILTPLNHSMQMARKYVAHGNVTKSQIAAELTSEKIHVGISDMKVFFHSLRSRGQTVFDNWGKIADAMIEISQAAINDEDMHEFYLRKSLTQFLKNMSVAALQIREKCNDYRQLYDVRFQIGSTDSFLRGLEDLMSDLDSYLKTSVLGTGFIRENFLQVDVFYKEKSYEHITHQPAYDLFAFMCDVGATMALFLGASILSVGEVIDLVLHQGINHFTHKVRH